MGRWADQDSDAERLPEGFERVGYDADTQVYTFRDRDGAYYESSSGNRYGVLRPVGNDSSHMFAHEEASLTSPKKPNHGDEESLDGEADLAEWQNEGRGARRHAKSKNPFEEGNRQAVKMMLPFALLVIVFMLFLFKFILGGSADQAEPQIACAEGHKRVEVQSGETCWKIATAQGLTVDELTGLQGNQDIDCEVLKAGQMMCVPN